MSLSPSLRIMEKALLKIAEDNGYEIIRVSPEIMSESKGQSRIEDEELIRSGHLTPEEVQVKNDICGGNIEVRDWSPVFA